MTVTLKYFKNSQNSVSSSSDTQQLYTTSTPGGSRSSWISQVPVPAFLNGCLRRPRFVVLFDVRAFSVPQSRVSPFRTLVPQNPVPSSKSRNSSSIRTEFRQLELQFHHQEFEFLRIWFHQQVLNQSSSTELSSCIFIIEIQVPRNSTEFRHLITE